MEFNSSIVINTNRLIFEPIHEKYIDDINLSFAQEVTKYMPFNPNGDKNVEQNFEFNYIIYPVDKENIRSRKIAEKLGFLPFETYKKKKMI